MDSDLLAVSWHGGKDEVALWRFFFKGTNAIHEGSMLMTHDLITSENLTSKYPHVEYLVSTHVFEEIQTSSLYTAC